MKASGAPGRPNVCGSTVRHPTHSTPRIAHMRKRKRVSPYARGTYSSWVARRGSASRETRNTGTASAKRCVYRSTITSPATSSSNTNSGRHATAIRRIPLPSVSRIWSWAPNREETGPPGVEDEGDDARALDEGDGLENSGDTAVGQNRPEDQGGHRKIGDAVDDRRLAGALARNEDDLEHRAEERRAQKHRQLRREGSQAILVERLPPPRRPDHDRHPADDSRQRQHRQTL